MCVIVQLPSNARANWESCLDGVKFHVLPLQHKGQYLAGSNNENANADRIVKLQLQRQRRWAGESYRNTGLRLSRLCPTKAGRSNRSLHGVRSRRHSSLLREV